MWRRGQRQKLSEKGTAEEEEERARTKARVCRSRARARVQCHFIRSVYSHLHVRPSVVRSNLLAEG